MKTVSVYSRKQASMLVPDGDKCLISISTPDAIYEMGPKVEGWRDVLFLEFYDADKPLGDYTIFDDSMAEQLLKFIRKNIKYNFVAHCDMGISRSVAVGVCMRNLLGFKLILNSRQHEHEKNMLVVDKMCKMFYRVFGDDFSE